MCPLASQAAQNHFFYSAFPVLNVAETHNQAKGSAHLQWQSAFPNISKWTCDCTMVSTSFIWTTASYNLFDGLMVKFKTNDNITEAIKIAEKWEMPCEPGYIGKGFTKQGIYVRHHLYIYIFIDYYLTYSRPVFRERNMLSHSPLIFSCQKVQLSRFWRPNMLFCAWVLLSRQNLIHMWRIVTSPLFHVRRLILKTHFVHLRCFNLRFLLQLWQFHSR